MFAVFSGVRLKLDWKQITSCCYSAECGALTLTVERPLLTLGDWYVAEMDRLESFQTPADAMVAAEAWLEDACDAALIILRRGAIDGP